MTAGRMKNLSHEFFKKTYTVDVYGYVEKVFSPVVAKYLLNAKGKILDAACGYRNYYLDRIAPDRALTVGADIDPTVKDINKTHEDFIIGDLHDFRPDHKFGAIISLYTWEHLRAPELVLENFSRCLSDGGVLIIIAPQKWSLISTAERLLPRWLKHLAWRLLKGRDKMPYPAYYRLCTRRSLAREAALRGFELEEFIAVEGPPLWFARVPPLFALMCLWMSIANKWGVLEGVRGTFLAVLRKKTGGKAA